MDYKRMLLYIALALVIMQLYTAWQMDYHPHSKTNAQQVANTKSNATNLSQGAPSIPQIAQSNSKVKQKTSLLVPKDRIINVKTDVLNIKIDSKGGNIIGSSLIKYPKTIKDPSQPFTLLNTTPLTYFTASSGLTGDLGPDTTQSQVQYSVKRSSYTMSPSQDELKVNLTWHNGKGLVVTKTFIFKRNLYVVDVQYHIDNGSKQDWQGHMYTQLSRSAHKPNHQSGLFHGLTYFGAAISSPEKLFEKVTFSDMNKANLNRTIKGGWAAMVQHYFVSAWVPSAKQQNHYYTSVVNGIYNIGMFSPEFSVASGQQKTVDARFYTGPEDTTRLKAVAPGLDLTLDYGIFWIISSAIFWLMAKIYSFVGNWGWSIILVTLLIKAVFYKLSATSYRSMAKMRRLQPQIASLKERCGADKQKFSRSLMEMYKKNKVNPLGGCLPIVVQIPVFLGLYWVLIESVQLRQAPFMFWIQDLSAKDPFYILPILMAASMFLQQKMSPAPPDPTQAKLMMAMPLVFGFLFANFPSGLVLYWLVNNVVSILQQWYITRKIDQEAKLTKA